MPASSASRPRLVQPVAPTAKPRKATIRPRPLALDVDITTTVDEGARHPSVATKAKPRATSIKAPSNKLPADKAHAKGQQGAAKARNIISVAMQPIAVKAIAVRPPTRKAATGRTLRSSTAKNKVGTVNERARQPGLLSGVAVNATRARRARVPADFAVQYGESAKTRKAKSGETGEETAVRRTRRDAQARERLRQIMTPDDDLLRRLARAGAIAIPLSNGVADDGHSAKRAAVRSVRRPRSWESRCGKCGVATVFKVAAGVCARCGAIALRTMKDER